MNLYDYQSKAVGQIVRLAKPGRATLAVGPTGCGKTVVGAVSALEISQGWPIVWIAHRRELVSQAAQSLRRFAPASVGVVASGVAADRGARIQVASVQTLMARGELPPGRVLVWDEAHHEPAEEYHQIHTAYRRVGVISIGLTATPERSDGKPLGDVYDRLVVIAQRSELIRSGRLVPTVVYSPKKIIDHAIADEPVKMWLRYAPGSRAIVFCSTVEHALDVERTFAANNVSAETVEAETPARVRERILQRFEEGRTLVVCNCMILTEGFDLPAIETIILARPCESMALYDQMVGRSSRACVDKKHAVVLDLVGAHWKHGLPDVDRVYSLEGKGIRQAERGGKPRRCPRCAYVNPPSTYTCGACGYEMRRSARGKPNTLGMKLMRMTREQVLSAKQSFFDHLVDHERLNGRGKEWIENRFRARFGEAPTGYERTRLP